ncbi:hypothetical protein QN277_025188 [Acacia crassicarpa]|uniref:Uncharacterized protein n=1 Tax=Acacia crassicarpa TaxID=499986 RepID=A0AAE1JDN0_9FABA|nr:hypothetical protein QN277_025188 [Acacia crassicarpa]
MVKSTADVEREVEDAERKVTVDGKCTECDGDNEEQWMKKKDDTMVSDLRSADGESHGLTVCWSQFSLL